MSHHARRTVFANQFENAFNVFRELATQETGYFMLQTLLASLAIFPYLVSERGGLGLLAFDEKHFMKYPALWLCADQIVVRDTHKLRVIKDRLQWKT